MYVCAYLLVASEGVPLEGDPADLSSIAGHDHAAGPGAPPQAPLASLPAGPDNTNTQQEQDRRPIKLA